MQFHIAKGNTAQRTPLPITLVLPDHVSLQHRLQAVAHSLTLTAFAYDQQGSGTVSVTDPWGQLFVVLTPSDEFAFDSGIQDIPLPCAPGTAAAIGAFYEQLYKVCCYVFYGPVSPSRLQAYKVYSCMSQPHSKGQEARISKQVLHCLQLLSKCRAGIHEHIDNIEKYMTGSDAKCRPG